MEFPNKATQFSSENQPKGRGRPAGVKNRSTVAKYWLSLEQKADNPITGEKDCVLSQEDIMALAMIAKARNGDVNAFKAIMDCAYGSSTSIDVTSTGKSVSDNSVSIVTLSDYVKLLESSSGSNDDNQD